MVYCGLSDKCVFFNMFGTVLEVGGAEGLVRDIISWIARRSLRRWRGLLMPISRWISVSDRADMMAPLFTLARQAATYHAGIPTQSCWGKKQDDWSIEINKKKAFEMTMWQHVLCKTFQCCVMFKEINSTHVFSLTEIPVSDCTMVLSVTTATASYYAILKFCVLDKNNVRLHFAFRSSFTMRMMSLRKLESTNRSVNKQLCVLYWLSHQPEWMFY